LDLSINLLDGKLVNDPVAAKNLVGLSAADAKKGSELAVGELPFTIKPDGNDLAGGLIKFADQSLVEIVRDRNRDRHMYSSVPFPAGNVEGAALRASR
jgi:hypothetical protein